VLLAVLTFGTGIVLGLRYRLVILVPAVALVIGLHVVMAISGSEGNAPGVISAVICSACIQGGYMIGLTARGLAGQLLSASSRNA